jgi:hypothetical protein
MIGSCRGTHVVDDAKMNAVLRDRLIHHSHIAGKCNVSKRFSGVAIVFAWQPSRARPKVGEVKGELAVVPN